MFNGWPFYEVMIIVSMDFYKQCSTVHPLTNWYSSSLKTDTHRIYRPVLMLSANESSFYMQTCTHLQVVILISSENWYSSYLQTCAHPFCKPALILPANLNSFYLQAGILIRSAIWCSSCQQTSINPPICKLLLYPHTTKLLGGILVSLCSSVCPSICLSLRPAFCVCSVVPTGLVGFISYI